MAYKVRTSTLPLLPKGAKPIKVLHFSDLHLHPRNKREIADIKTFIDLRPDLVISTGDFLAHKDGVDIALNALDELLDLPGLFVFGSNDYYAPQFKTPLSYLRKNNGDINFQQLPERFEDEKNKLPKNYVLINFTKEAKMYFYIKPSTYKYYGNNRASIDTWAYYDDKSSLKDDELADGFAGHLVNCKEKKLGTYFVKALNKNNKIIQDAAYGEPEYATIDTILPPGSVLDAMANLVCNPYHLFPQVNEEEANNEENWTRIYTDVEGNDHFYLKNSIKKNGNIISAVIKDVYKDKKLNALDQFKILKT